MQIGRGGGGVAREHGKRDTGLYIKSVYDAIQGCDS